MYMILVINKCNMAKNSAMWNVHIESMILVLTVKYGATWPMVLRYDMFKLFVIYTCSFVMFFSVMLLSTLK